MRQTKLVLIEGIPGSGNTRKRVPALAQFLLDQYLRGGVPASWHYEEERAHPAMVFHDQASLQQVCDDLAAGRYRQVTAAALTRWRRFAELVQRRDGVTILDSCYFGYLTWSLFPLEVPEDEIHACLAEVTRILNPCQPHLIYLFQDDVAAALAKVCTRRGWQGAVGTVAYWMAHRHFTDAAFARVGFPKLAIENGAGDWPRYHRQVLAFLSLAPLPDAANPSDDLERFAGRYVSVADAGQTCTVRCEDGVLDLDGVRGGWPRTPLLPRAGRCA